MKANLPAAVAQSLAHVVELEGEIAAAAPASGYGIAADYDRSLSELLQHEGGYSNDAADPGGPTKWGITIIDARKYWKPGATAADVKAMPVSIAKDIYRAHYAAVVRFDELPAGVDYAVFDYAVNSGVSRAAKVLQKCVGAPVTGVIGAATVAAALRAKPSTLVTAICDERLAFLKRLKTWPVFGGGWGRRVAEVRTVALKMATGTAPPPAVAPAKPAKKVDPKVAGPGGAAAGGAIAAHQAGLPWWAVILIGVAFAGAVFLAIHHASKKA